MAETVITPGSWQTVAAITAATAFVNKSYRTMFFTTGSTGGLALDKGIELPPYQPVVIDGAFTVSASVFGGSATVAYESI